MRRISNKPITEATFLDSLNREIVPAIRGIQSAIVAIEGTSLVELEARVDALEDDFVLIELDVVDHEARLDALDIDLADHETRIVALEASEGAFKATGYSQGYTSLGAAVGTHYWKPYGDNLTVPGTNIDLAKLMVHRDGVIKELGFINRTPNGDVDTFTLTLNVNGSATALTVSGSGDTSTLQLDSTHSVSVAQGDFFCFEQVNAGGQNVNSRPVMFFVFEET